MAGDDRAKRISRNTKCCRDTLRMLWSQDDRAKPGYRGNTKCYRDTPGLEQVVEYAIVGKNKENNMTDNYNDDYRNDPEEENRDQCE